MKKTGLPSTQPRPLPPSLLPFTPYLGDREAFPPPTLPSPSFSEAPVGAAAFLSEGGECEDDRERFPAFLGEREGEVDGLLQDEEGGEGGMEGGGKS